jgi:hypothetical protein
MVTLTLGSLEIMHHGAKHRLNSQAGGVMRNQPIDDAGTFFGVMHGDEQGEIEGADLEA